MTVVNSSRHHWRCRNEWKGLLLPVRPSGNIVTVLESRNLGPHAKIVAAMLGFEAAVGSRYITFCKDGTKGTATASLPVRRCASYKNNIKKKTYSPLQKGWRS